MNKNEVVNRAIEYILLHICEEISIEDVAEACNFSKYYFSRMFKDETGESIYSFIKRVKLEQSAFRLKVEQNRSITEIGYDYGYSPSNYSSAFKQYHAKSPANFRKNIYEASISHPFFHPEDNKILSFEECNKNISIEYLDDIFVIYERKIGNYHNLNVDWTSFLEKYKEYVSDETLYIERTFDDPSITDLEGCLYDICISIDKKCSLENTYMIKGGKFAVYHFKGYTKQIYAAYQMILNIWFPKSSHEIDERYGYEIYRKIDCNTMYTEIDFCIPIK